eukprot:scaffold14.g1307.t1
MPDTKAAQPLQQFYVATTAEAKLATLLDLLRAFEAAAPLSLVVCCGARDSLDAVCTATLAVPHSRVWCLHASLSESEMARTVERFAAAAGTGGGGGSSAAPASEAGAPAPGGAPAAAPAPAGARGNADAAAPPPPPPLPLIEVLATTDACLRALPKEVLPLAPTLLVHYDLPLRKEAYVRRTTAVVGSRSRVGESRAGGGCAFFLCAGGGPAPGLTPREPLWPPLSCAPRPALLPHPIPGLPPPPANPAPGSKRLAISFVVAGEAEAFRALEGFAEPAAIREMPVHVSDILAPRA